MAILEGLVGSRDPMAFQQARVAHGLVSQMIGGLVDSVRSEDRWVLALTKDALTLFQKYQAYLKTVIGLCSPDEFPFQQIDQAPLPAAAKPRLAKLSCEPPPTKKHVWLAFQKGETIHVWKSRESPKGWMMGRIVDSTRTGLLPIAFLES